MQEVVSIVVARLIKHWISKRLKRAKHVVYAVFFVLAFSVGQSVPFCVLAIRLKYAPYQTSWCILLWWTTMLQQRTTKANPPPSNLLLIHVGGTWQIKLFFVGARLSIMREGCTSSIAVFSLFKLISLVTKNEVSSFDDFYIVLFQILTDCRTGFTLVLQDDYRSGWCHGHQSPG